MKVWNYCVISVALAFILQLANVPVAESVLDLVGLGLTSQSVGNSALLIALTIILAAAAVTGVVVGFFTKSNTENILLLGFITGSVLLFGASFYGVLSAVSSYDAWIKYIVWGIFGPLAVGFIIAIAEFFRGTD